MKKFLLSFFVLLGMTTAANASVEIWPGTKSYTDATWQSHSVPSISIDNLNAGDWAAIMDGTYTEQINFGGTYMSAAEVKAQLAANNYGYVKFSKEIALNSDDLAAMNQFSTVVLDLRNATFAEDIDLTKFATKDPLEYAAFPAACEDLGDLASASINDAFKAAAAYSSADKRAVGYVKEEGKFNAALFVCTGQNGNDVGYPVESWGGYWHGVLPTTLTLAGNINAIDLIGNWPNGANNYTLATDGHLYYPTLPEGLTQRERQTGSWGNGPKSVETLDLTNAKFSHINDMSLSDLGYVSLTNLSLPISEDTIPVNCLNATVTLTKLCVPSNYKVIQALAFPSSLNHITATGVDEDGNTIEIDNGERSITFSKGLEKIETHAFFNVTGVKDVYVLNKVAPICELDAFSTITYFANNTLHAPSSATAIDRDSYYCGEDQWMAVLHYPADANTYDLASKFTDVTRDFSIASGERDGRGNIIMYPNFSEMSRAYIQACTGYTWNSTINERIVGDPNRPYWLEMLNNGSDEVAASGKDATSYVLKPNGQPTAVYDEENYGGWHQFLLGSYSPLVEDDDVPEKEYYVYNTGNVYDSEWWTICLPIPLTKAMMLDVFGDEKNSKYPKLCRFVGVDRVVGEKIVLRFGEDLVAAAANDDDVVLEAGRPYMIKPQLPSGNTDPDSRIVRVPIDNTNKDIYKTLSNDEQMAMLKDNVEIVPADNIRIFADAAAYEAKTPTDASADTGVNAPYTNYTFVGSFWKYCLPQYSYFLGWDKDAQKVKYFWKYSPVDEANRSWNTCTAVICPNWNTEAGFVIPAAGTLETVHWNLTNFSQSDAFAGWPEAQNVEYAFDCETDGISTVHMADGSTVNFAKGTVYNISGQAVKASQMGKGLYIVNGKKIIVK